MEYAYSNKTNFKEQLLLCCGWLCVKIDAFLHLSFTLVVFLLQKYVYCEICLPRNKIIYKHRRRQMLNISKLIRIVYLIIYYGLYFINFISGLGMEF